MMSDKQLADVAGAEYWRMRMDKAFNPDDFAHAFNKWWMHAIGPNVRIKNTGADNA